jgi:hypothetical protein
MGSEAIFVTICSGRIDRHYVTKGCTVILHGTVEFSCGFVLFCFLLLLSVELVLSCGRCKGFYLISGMYVCFYHGAHGGWQVCE